MTGTCPVQAASAGEVTLFGCPPPQFGAKRSSVTRVTSPFSVIAY